MKDLTSKLQNVAMFAIGLAMAGTVSVFGLFVILGALLVSLVALPLGMLAMLIASRTATEANEETIDVEPAAG